MLLQDILNQSGVTYRKGKRGDPNEVVLCCPFCGDSEFHLGLNIENGKAHCFRGRCEWRSRNLLYTARALCEVWGINFDWRMRLTAAEAEEAEAAKPVVVEAPLPIGLPEGYERFNKLPDDEIEGRAADYLWDRGFGRDEIEAYQIGFATAGKFAWRVLFPVIGEDGLIYGCVGRAFDDRAEPKYLNTEGIKLLWNGQHQAKHAVVCEGVMDAAAVGRIVAQSFPGYTAVGALGSAITPQQIAQLAKYDSAIQFPDFDAAGVKGAVQRAEACTEAGIETWIIEPPVMDERDPGSMSSVEIAEFLRSAKPWNKAQKFRMRLSALR